MRILNAWRNAEYIGSFYYIDGKYGFRYDSSVKVPISLSLPLDGTWVKNAPKNFLSNLLPESRSGREFMRAALQASSTDVFDLLDKVDSSGGLVFSSSDSNPYTGVPEEYNVLMYDDVAKRVFAARNSDSDWWSKTSKFSIAGNQPKITLHFDEFNWVDPNVNLPSTHILKANRDWTSDASIIEVASLKLARLVGLTTSSVTLMNFGGVGTFVTERFDRFRHPNGYVYRVQSEDLLQAIGRPEQDKYKVSAKQLVNILRLADPDDKLVYDWVAQLAFNYSINNVDSHAKNYSVLIDGAGIRMSPLYDALTTTYWSNVDKRLPMKIGGAEYAGQLSPNHWAKFARVNNLDPERVVAITRTTSYRVLQLASSAYANVPVEIRDRVLSEIGKANANAKPSDILQGEQNGIKRP